MVFKWDTGVFLFVERRKIGTKDAIYLCMDLSFCYSYAHHFQSCNLMVLNIDMKIGFWYEKLFFFYCCTFTYGMTILKLLRRHVGEIDCSL